MSSEKLFQEKLEILNCNFVRFLTDSLKDKPHADCTPTVKDYLNHVEELDKMYGGPGEQSSTSIKIMSKENGLHKDGKESNRLSFAQAYEQHKDSLNKSLNNADKNESVSSITVTSTNATISRGESNRKRRNEDEDPYFSNKFGSKSATQQNGEKDAESKRKRDDSAKKPQLTFGASPEKKTPPSSGNALPSLSEMFKPKPGSWNCPTCMTTNQAHQSECPCCSTKKPGGSEKPKDDLVKNTPVTSAIPSFGLFQPQQTSDDSAKKPQLTFGASPEKKTPPSSGNALPSLSEMFKPKPGSWNCPTCMTTNQSHQSECPCCSTKKPGSSEKPKDDLAKKTPVTSTSAIPSFGLFQPQQTSPLSFGTSNTTAASSTTSTLPSFGLQSKPGSSLIFGKSSTTFGSGSATTPVFSFGLKPSSAPAAEDKKDEDGEDDDKEEEPPKPEEVEQTEKGAVCSHECMVHSFVDSKWEKKGKGYASIKNLEESDKKQLIIRAANTLGTVWTNTLINSSLKWSKVKDKSQKETQLRISYPTPGKDAAQITTLLLKFGSEVHTKELCDHFE